jgi:hypothetical protein
MLESSGGYTYWDIWDCGNWQYSNKGSTDAIKFTKMRTDYQSNSWYGGVLTHSNAYIAWDSRNACAPSVIRHDYITMLNLFAQASGFWAPEAYMMYYECEPQFFNITQTWILGPTSICLAVSSDGVSWFRYSDPAGNGDGRFVLSDDPTYYVTPVITTAMLAPGGACGHNVVWSNVG